MWPFASIEICREPWTEWVPLHQPDSITPNFRVDLALRDMPLKEYVNVEALWNKLEEMERRLSFAGQAYPDGMCAFPFRLKGQGFFPGGDGLWRDEGALSEPTSGALPNDGVMFLGNDFGTLQSFCRLQGRGFENPPTWKHLKARIRRANVPSDRMFCSNVIIGLRNGTGGLGARKEEVAIITGIP